MPITKLAFDDSVKLLEEVGVQCRNEDIISSFESTQLAGYDSERGRIHILRDLVKCCLDSVPKKSKFPVPNKSFGTGGIAAYVIQGDNYIEPCIDIHTAEIARISEEFKLPFMFRGVGSKLSAYDEVKQINIMRKWYNGYIYVRTETNDGLWRAKLDHEINGNICTTHSVVNSPLKINDTGNNVNLFLKTVKMGLPVYLTSMPMTCLTAPATLYGVGILAFAEFLVGLCLSQILNPGLTVVNGAYPAATDPRNNYSPALGSIYHNLTNWTIGQVSEEQDLPSIQSGCTISSKYHNPEYYGGTDYETERGYKMWNTWNGWHQVRHSMGFVNQLIAFDINKMRRDCNVLKRVIEGNENIDENINELEYDSEAVDVIGECIERGENFKDHIHTSRNVGIIQ